MSHLKLSKRKAGRTGLYLLLTLAGLLLLACLGVFAARSAARSSARRGLSPAPAVEAQAPGSEEPGMQAAEPQAEAGEKPGEEPEKEEADSPQEAVAWYSLRFKGDNGQIPADGLAKANLEVQAKLSNSLQSPAGAGVNPAGWQWIGPGNIGGRVRALLADPTDPNRLWAGGVGGGVWETIDGGANWQPVGDNMSNLAVSSLAMDAANQSILYAGTGEGFYNGDGIRGAGIYKTTDGGATWTQLAATSPVATTNFLYVNRLAAQPGAAGVLLAATQTGLYRSSDGGQTWTKVIASEALDVQFNPADGSKATASGNYRRAWYSSDGGLTWNAATFTGGITGGTSYAYRVESAYAPSDPSIVYASVDANGGELWKSSDGGMNYARINTGHTTLANSQGWYDNALWVDPTISTTLIVGGVDLFRSTDGGVTLTNISNVYSGGFLMHPDQHVVIAAGGFNGSTNKTIYVGNDGGVFTAADAYSVASNSGWTALNHNLGITQFYGGAGNPISGKIVGGTQDNGSLIYTGDPQSWTRYIGGDGGFAASDPTDPNYFYGETQYGNLFRTSNAGASVSYIGNPNNSCGLFIPPFILDPNNPNTLLTGGCRLYRNVNVKGSPSWISIKDPTGSNISAIAVAPGNSDRIWVGDAFGGVYTTTNGTADTPAWAQVDGALPNRYVGRITIDPNDHNIVYVSFGGYTSNNVWRTTDGGASWSPRSGSGVDSLPAAPVNDLEISPTNPNWLYAGTEVGIFTSEDGGATWQIPQSGPVYVAIDELFWLGPHLTAVSHGRGMYSYNSAPSAPSSSYATLEDQPLIVAAPGVLQTASDPESDPISAALAGGPSQGALALNASGAFTYTPSADTFGADAFSFTASDGSLSSSPVSVTLTITPVNDAPGFTPGSAVTVLNNSGPYSAAWATGISAGPANESAQSVAFTLTNDAPGLFSVPPAISPGGQLTFTPDPAASGTANLNVSLQDNGGVANGGIDTSTAYSLTIKVAPALVYPGGATATWNTTITTTAPCGPTFQGEYGAQTVTLALKDLPPHSAVSLSFDLYILKSWDGNQANWPAAFSNYLKSLAGVPALAPNEIVGPDRWTLAADGRSLLDTTFTNWDSLGFHQAFPGWFAKGDFPARTGAQATNQMCYAFGGVPMDSRYSLSYFFPHSAKDLTLDFSALGLSGIADESWGLNNVRVTLSPNFISSFLPVVQKP